MLQVKKLGLILVILFFTFSSLQLISAEDEKETKIINPNQYKMAWHGVESGEEVNGEFSVTGGNVDFYILDSDDWAAFSNIGSIPSYRQRELSINSHSFNYKASEAGDCYMMFINRGITQVTVDYTRFENPSSFFDIDFASSTILTLAVVLGILFVVFGGLVIGRVLFGWGYAQVRMEQQGSYTRYETLGHVDSNPDAPCYKYKNCYSLCYFSLIFGALGFIIIYAILQII